MKQGNIIFLKTAVFVIGTVILGLCIFALPVLAKYSAEMNPAFAYLQYPVQIGLYLTTIPFYIALYQTLRLLNIIHEKNTFSEGTVKRLGFIKHCASMIILLYLLGLVLLIAQNALHPGIALIGLIVVFTSIIIRFFSSLIQVLLINAISQKMENDLTI
ncbi:DUF2975 domain-containing protein [Lysinibacillus fusiformis]|nr:DUF2975 domain-containing protein [Lysinibacillus fusiformis]